MIDFENIEQQIDLSKKAVLEMKKQNRIFESVLEESIKNAPVEYKKDIEKAKIVYKKAIELAKKGKSEEAQKIINNFKNVSTNS